MHASRILRLQEVSSSKLLLSIQLPLLNVNCLLKAPVEWYRLVVAQRDTATEKVCPRHRPRTPSYNLLFWLSGQL